MRYYILLIIFFLFSCTRPDKAQTSDKGKNGFASSFSISGEKDFIVLNIINPWQNAQNVRLTYILSNNPDKVPDSLKIFPVIQTPVKTVIALSSTHIGFISALHKTEGIIGISGEQFINDTVVLESLKSGKCFDVGYAPNLDYEKMLSLKPDLVFLYGVDASVQGVSERLTNAGIPTVIISEYLENHPLGKAEWIKFFAAIYGLSERAATIFDSIRNNYELLADSVGSAARKPAILAGLPWKDTWFLPGGTSFQSRFIIDAGGIYLWKDDKSNETIPLDLESVFVRAVDADVWINTGTAGSMNEIIMRDKRFGLIKAFKNGTLYNNDARLSRGGGNDYWESGVIHPDIILRDLIEIFHPGLLSKHKLVYYRKLE